MCCPGWNHPHCPTKDTRVSGATVARGRSLRRVGERHRRVRCLLLGAVAQLEEHLLCTQGARGSSPLSSTDPPTPAFGGLAETLTAPGSSPGSASADVARSAERPALTTSTSRVSVGHVWRGAGVWLNGQSWKDCERSSALRGFKSHPLRSRRLRDPTRRPGRASPQSTRSGKSAGDSPGSSKGRSPAVSLEGWPSQVEGARLLSEYRVLYGALEGSNPSPSALCSHITRLWCNGNTSAFQAENARSIRVSRSHIGV